VQKKRGGMGLGLGGSRLPAGCKAASASATPAEPGVVPLPEQDQVRLRSLRMEVSGEGHWATMMFAACTLP
jgi:hypothetical protein